MNDYETLNTIVKTLIILSCIGGIIVAIWSIIDTKNKRSKPPAKEKLISLLVTKKELINIIRCYKEFNSESDHMVRNRRLLIEKLESCL